MSAEFGDCLIGFPDTAPPSTRMGLCDEDGVDEYAFTVEGDEVSIRYSYEFTSGPDSSETINECLWWDGDHLDLGENCGETTWHFTYLRTDEAEDGRLLADPRRRRRQQLPRRARSAEHLRGGLLTDAPPLP